ncbi:hypothetical protein A2J04_01140 [Rhodococcus sp. EPR-279]|uniref:hypothetical protein n=1 Tax=Rhodococcus sp. EPR-279 TaxID=1813678 RepID=UPI0007BB2BDD|nr:hypothetical protein [Rhodococcus sp. EPR-279]KZF08456.1 hypothetical protein A2J04_01140 [Rhodococcus sp. EPR-279]
MRTTLRTLAIASACTTLALVAPASALAAEPEDIRFSFAVDGNSVTNTITNSSGTVIGCGTSLAPAPNGVLPPVLEVIGNGQSLYTNGDTQPGSTVQTIADVPAGSYVALASCTSVDGDTTTAWISDYPGLDEFLNGLPWTSHKVEQSSTVVTVEPSTPTTALGSLLNSGSAN